MVILHLLRRAIIQFSSVCELCFLSIIVTVRGRRLSCVWCLAEESYLRTPVDWSLACCALPSRMRSESRHSATRGRPLGGRSSSRVPGTSSRLGPCLKTHPPSHMEAVRTGQGMLTRPLLLWCSCPARSSEQLLSCPLVPSDFEHHWNHCPVSSSKQKSSRVPKCRIPFKIWLDWHNVSGIFKISYLKGNPFWSSNLIMDQNHICLIPGDLCWEERL